ncbi:MAG: AN1-type zinc finger domain-containing protein [Candidatus Bathyarchaeales archaeon]
MECQKCGKEVFLPFRCPYCGGYFCSEHRLPENHECPRMDLARVPQKEEPALTLTPQTPKSYEYTVTYVPVEAKKKFYFSSKEVKHLTIGAFLVMGIGLSLGISPTAYRALGSPTMLWAFALLVTASFFIHELAHKFAAQKEGLWAEFRLMFVGIILTAISIISPLFKIISPGAVVIAGFASKKSIGKISIAGPSTNIILSALLAALWFITSQPILLFAAAFNAWIALFNLIPFGILDGFKVFSWNKAVWASTFTLSLALTIITSFYW